MLQFIIYFTRFRILCSYLDNFCLHFVRFLNLKLKSLLVQSFIVLQIQSKMIFPFKSPAIKVDQLRISDTSGRTLVTFTETSRLEKRTVKLNSLHAAGLHFQNLSRVTSLASIVLYTAVCSTTKFRTDSFCGT